MHMRTLGAGCDAMTTMNRHHVACRRNQDAMMYMYLRS